MSDPEHPEILFLDIDGTVRHGYDEIGRFVNEPGDVHVFPEAVERIKQWKGDVAGALVVGISNQGGIGAGHVTEDAVRATMAETDRQTGNRFDLLVYCPHAPDAGCWCRKPLPGMMFDALRRVTGAVWRDSRRDRCLFVGDRPEDEQCAAAAGVPFQWAAEWRAGHV